MFDSRRKLGHRLKVIKYDNMACIRGNSLQALTFKSGLAVLKHITATTHVLSRSKTDEFLMHMTEHFVNINYNHQIDIV